MCVIFQDRCIYHSLVWSNLNFLYISLWITFPTQSCLVLYSFFTNLLHSLIMWLVVSSLSPHSLHLLFCWVLSILAWIWLVLRALSCVAIRRDSISLLRFPFLSQLQYHYFIACHILTSAFAGVFYSSLSDSKFPHVCNVNNPFVSIIT